LAAKKKEKKQEADLFSNPEPKIRKPKEWKFPKGIRYSEVNVGDILVITQSRDWNRAGVINEARGVVLEKGKLDAQTQYFKVKMVSAESDALLDEDIRRFVIVKK
jgi:hypothetical protein